MFFLLYYNTKFAVLQFILSTFPKTVFFPND